MRPPLFPARQKKTNDRFARRLERFLSRRNLTAEAERRGQDLIDRYRSTAK